MNKALILVGILAVSVVATAYAVTHRYTAIEARVGAQSVVYIVDRLTGSAQACVALECRPATVPNQTIISFDDLVPEKKH